MGEEGDGEAYFGVEAAFSPPEADVLVAVVAVELEPEPLEPQPAASSSAAQASAALHVDWRTVPRNFLTGSELSATELNVLLDRALALKAAPLSSRALDGLSVALIFQKPSTRTRLSFEVGVHELGGHPVVLRSEELQLARGEALRDTAIVISRHVAAVGVRTGPQETLSELAEHSAIPVINMLTARHHPCQALADLLTLREAHGSLDGLR